MNNSNETIPLNCPSCHKPIHSTLKEIITWKKVKCPSCHGEIIFDTMAVNNVSRAIKDLEKAENNFEMSRSKIMQKASFLLKK
ncbi:MAG: hypothetical protein ACHQQQ_15110 [Bacteroidota bacterium]